MQQGVLVAVSDQLSAVQLERRRAGVSSALAPLVFEQLDARAESRSANPSMPFHPSLPPLPLALLLGFDETPDGQLSAIWAAGPRARHRWFDTE
jgi:hypothetical protein